MSSTVRIVGEVESGAGEVPRVDSRLSWRDRVAAWKARWTIMRMSMGIAPGLYALGTPTPQSPVLVSANYRLSFDTLRASVPGLDAWILVLDSKGINVWCAAGKGTFGTEEIVRRVATTRLSEVVSHRTLVVPQLGAPGVAAHEVKARSGFRVVFGPVRARDLPAYLAAGMRATPAQRRVRFPVVDRVRVIPAELVPAAKIALTVGAAFVVASGLGRDGYSLERVLAVGVPSLVIVFLSGALASILTPLLLPWLPGRAFSLKGLWIGLALAGAAVLWLAHAGGAVDWATAIGWLLMVPALSSFVAMNFTGASTYTSLSGVLWEMRVAVRMQAIAGATGVLLWLAGRFV